MVYNKNYIYYLVRFITRRTYKTVISDYRNVGFQHKNQPTQTILIPSNQIYIFSPKTPCLNKLKTKKIPSQNYAF